MKSLSRIAIAILVILLITTTAFAKENFQTSNSSVTQATVANVDAPGLSVNASPISAEEKAYTQQEEAGRLFTHAVILSFVVLLCILIYFIALKPLSKELKAKRKVIKRTNVDIYDDDWDIIHNLSKKPGITEPTIREIARDWEDFCKLRQKIALHKGVTGWREAGRKFRRYRFTLSKLKNMVDNDIAIASFDNHL